MKRPWERQTALVGVPFGWRRPAWAALAIAAEHGLKMYPLVRWAPVAHPRCPALQLIDHVLPDDTLPAQREALQRFGRALTNRVAARATAYCMGCGTTATPPAHVSLHVHRSTYVVLICADCEALATANGYDYWDVIGRLDPLFFSAEDPDDSGWRVGPDDGEPTDDA
jgi:hypothetical protein